MKLSHFTKTRKLFYYGSLLDSLFLFCTFLCLSYEPEHSNSAGDALEPLDDEDAPVDDVEDGEGGWEEDAGESVDEDCLLPSSRVILQEKEQG